MQKIKNKIFSFLKDKVAVDRLMYQLEDFELNLAPLNIKIQPNDGTKRVSVFLLEINFNYFFGGYIGMLNFAKLFYQSGYKVRIITTNNNEINLDLWRQKIKKYKGLGKNIDSKFYPGKRHDLLHEVNRDEVTQDIIR